MVNVLPEYRLSTNLSGTREVTLKVTEDTNEIVYDSEGKKVEDGYDEDGKLKEGYTKVDEKINKAEVLTQENYKNAKKVLEKRLQVLGVEEYTIRQELTSGLITINLPENSDTDEIVSNLEYKGKFEIIDSETEEILISNKDVKEAKVAYANTDFGTSVYLSIEFNKEGKKKLEEITKTYISSTDEEGNETTKEIKINLDDEEILETYFEEEITSGILQLTFGTTTNNATLASYIKQVTRVASLITDNRMEIQYEIDTNTYLSSVIDLNKLQPIILLAILLVLIAILVLCIKFRMNGALASISYVGYIALLFITLRYTNVTLSLEGIVGIVTVLIANYTFLKYVLIKLNKEQSFKDVIKEAYIHYVWILLPLLLISVVFTFITYTPIASIGMIMFWGIVVLLIYNYVITRTLLKKIERKEI